MSNVNDNGMIMYEMMKKRKEVEQQENIKQVLKKESNKKAEDKPKGGKSSSK